MWYAIETKQSGIKGIKKKTIYMYSSAHQKL